MIPHSRDMAVSMNRGTPIYRSPNAMMLVHNSYGDLQTLTLGNSGLEVDPGSSEAEEVSAAAWTS